MDDIEDQFANVDYVSLAADRAAYKMADAMDADVLSYLSGYTLQVQLSPQHLVTHSTTLQLT
jgi:hypothetical protein